MITYEWLYWLAGAFFAFWSILSLRDQHFVNSAFWGILAGSFFLGTHLSDWANGVLVLALVAIAGLGGLKRSEPETTTNDEREKLSQTFGNKLFIPALIVPITAVAGTLLYNYTPLSETGLFEPPPRNSHPVWHWRRHRLDRGDGVVAAGSSCSRRGRAPID